MNLREEIEKVAYELYEKGGRIGRDLENWLEAEKIVMARHRKELSGAAKQMEHAAGSAAQKVTEVLKETVTVLKNSGEKGLKKDQTNGGGKVLKLFRIASQPLPGCLIRRFFESDKKTKQGGDTVALSTILHGASPYH